MFTIVKKVLSICFSKKPKLYRIYFGPIQGMKIFTSFQISPRMLLGFDEPWLAKIVKKYIQDGDIVYDIGAHIGYTSLLFAKLVGKNGKVYAFELLPSVAKQYLQKTINANQLHNIIEVHPVGLSDRKEQIEIYVGKTMMGNLDVTGYESEFKEICNIETLDQYFIDKQLTVPKLLKIDIERAENHFLRGSKNIIEKYKPILIIEFHNLDLLKEGFHILESMNYSLECDDGKLSLSDINKMKSFYGNILSMPL